MPVSDAEAAAEYRLAREQLKEHFRLIDAINSRNRKPEPQGEQETLF